MPQEIERQWLLARLPENLGEGIEIFQGYLATGDPEVRVRRKGVQFFLTRKSGEGEVRDEGKGDIEISAYAFEILWPLTAGAQLRKLRYRVISPDGLVWEVDEYRDQLASLVVVEVELPGETYIPCIPEVINPHVVREVTNDLRYQDKNLAVRGLPKERDCHRA
ncbi:MAG: adenylate cyclase [bacterium]|nr:adenylate cyclase [bacterium]MDZ4285987.1 adenylate cyclase [Candidatus Sungbacteria bacterium]